MKHRCKLHIRKLGVIRVQWTEFASLGPSSPYSGSIIDYGECSKCGKSFSSLFPGVWTEQPDAPEGAITRLPAVAIKSANRSDFWWDISTFVQWSLVAVIALIVVHAFLRAS